MAARWINLENVAFAVLLVVAIAAAIFHFSQGRWPNGIIAIAAVVAGILLLTVRRFQNSAPLPQPEPQPQSVSVPSMPASVRQEIPRVSSGARRMPRSFAVSGTLRIGKANCFGAVDLL